MDLRNFYQKIRQLEAEIAPDHVVVVSLETPDGGKAGSRTEVARLSAARLMVEGRARLANEEETEEYRAQQESGRLEAEERVLQERVVVNLMPAPRPRKRTKD